MRITPIEIRQKTFEAKAFRGIDKDEVQAFLSTLSQEWDKLLEENRQQKTALERAESQVSKMREVETGLYQTLKTAQDTSASITDKAQREAQELKSTTEKQASTLLANAKQEAEQRLTAARQEADKLLSDARSTAKKQLDEAQKESERITGSMQTRLTDLEREYKQLQGHFDKLVADLRTTANGVLERAEAAQNLRAKAGPLPAAPKPAPTGNPAAAAANKETEQPVSLPSSPADMPTTLAPPRPVATAPVAAPVDRPTAGGPHPGMPEIAPMPGPATVPSPTPPSVEPPRPDIVPPPSAPPVERPHPEITPQQPQPVQPQPLPPTPSPAQPSQPAPSPVPQPQSQEAPKPATGGSFFDEI
jgi:cell division initiation protein